MSRAGRPGFFGWLIGLGPIRSTVLLTVVTAAASLAIAAAATAALGRLSLMGLLFSVGIPGVLVPATWHPFFRVSARLDAAQARLRASEAKHRSILSSMHEAYLEVDLEGRVVFFNEALCRITGYRREEIQGRPIAEFVSPEGLRLLQAALRRRRHRDSPGDIDAFPLMARDGTARVLEATFSRLAGGAGGAAGFFAVVRDVTERAARERERREHEEQLRRARRMESIGLLAGGVAHDLNNILGGLVGYPDLLLLECPEHPALRKGLTAIRSAGERAAGIVQDLLALARRGVGATEALDLNRVVLDHLESQEHAQLRRDHPAARVATELAAGLPAVQGSAVHFAKAVMNLVHNAVEALTGEGTVTITTASRRLDRPLQAYERIPAGEHVTLSVADTGKGMTAEDLERIFEPFYTRKVLGRSGTGLGMAVVWGVVKDHSGWIDIRSEVGSGTTVTLYFPPGRDPVPDPVVPEDLGLFRGAGERVLVVDDLEDQRELAARMLARLGYEVEAAPDGAGAEQMVLANPPDLVLLDMIMPGGADGLETCRIIRGVRPGLRIVLVSGYAENDRVREAVALGGVWFLRKPYRIDTLARLAREALGAG